MNENNNNNDDDDEKPKTSRFARMAKRTNISNKQNITILNGW